MSLSKSIYLRQPTPVDEIHHHPAYQARIAHTHTLESSDKTMFFALMDFVGRVKSNPQRYVNGIGWSEFMMEFNSVTSATDVFDELERMNVYRLVRCPSRLEPIREIDPDNEARFERRPQSLYLAVGLINAAKKEAERRHMTFSGLAAQAIVLAFDLLRDDPELRNEIVPVETY